MGLSAKNRYYAPNFLRVSAKNVQLNYTNKNLIIANFLHLYFVVSASKNSNS